MEIYRWKLDTQRLNRIPTNERALYFLLGHAINEINVLNKLFYLSNQYDDSERWRQHAHITQGMVLARTLSGKLWEAWKLLGKAYFETKLALDYNPELNDNAKEALKILGKYFGSGSLMSLVRNSFSFHYSVDEIENALSEDLNPDELISYMSNSNGNTVHYFSEYAINVAILNAIDEGNPAVAMDRLMAETVETVRFFNETAQGIMIVTAERYLRLEDGTVELESIDIGDVPIAEDLEIPFFFKSRLRDEDVD